MHEIFKDIWQFKDLGFLWAIWFAVILLAAREIPKKIEEEKNRIIFFCGLFIIIIFTIIGMVGSCEPTPVTQDDTPEVFTPENTSVPVDESVALEDTTQGYEGIVDARFIEGSWRVIDTDSVMSEMRFTTDTDGPTIVTGNLSGVLENLDNARGRHPWKITGYNLQYKTETELFLRKKAKNQMTGEVTIIRNGELGHILPTTKNKFEITFERLQ